MKTPTTRSLATPEKKMGNYWDVYSPKAGRRLRLWPDLNYYFWVLLESDPEIVEVCDRPLIVRARVKERWVSSTLDMWYRTTNQSEVFCAVRYRKSMAHEIDGRRDDEKLTAQLSWAKRAGVRYCVASDATIWARPQLIANWIYILSFLDESTSKADANLGARIVRAIAVNRQATLRAVETMFPTESMDSVRSSLFKQLHCGQISADLATHRLSGHTIFKTRT